MFFVHLEEDRNLFLESWQLGIDVLSWSKKDCARFQPCSTLMLGIVECDSSLKYFHVRTWFRLKLDLEERTNNFNACHFLEFLPNAFFFFKPVCSLQDWGGNMNICSKCLSRIYQFKSLLVISIRRALLCSDSCSYCALNNSQPMICRIWIPLYIALFLHKRPVIKGRAKKNKEGKECHKSKIRRGDENSGGKSSLWDFVELGGEAMLSPLLRVDSRQVYSKHESSSAQSNSVSLTSHTIITRSHTRLSTQAFIMLKGSSFVSPVQESCPRKPRPAGPLQGGIGSAKRGHKRTKSKVATVATNSAPKYPMPFECHPKK